LQNLGWFDEANECYSRAIKLKQKDSEFWSRKGKVLDELGKFQEAISSHSKAIQLNPKEALY